MNSLVCTSKFCYSHKLKLTILLQKCRGSLFHKNWWVSLWQQACYLQYGSRHKWKWHLWCGSHRATPQLLAILLVVPVHSLWQISGHHSPWNTNIMSSGLYLYLYWQKFRFWDACMRLNLYKAWMHIMGYLTGLL